MLFVAFPLQILIFYSLSFISASLITICLGVFLLGLILYGTLLFLDLSVSFPMLEKFSAIMSSNISRVYSLSLFFF